MIVTPGVVADRVAVLDLAPHDAGIGLHGAADHEKRRAHVLGAQHGEDFVGVRRIRPVVVGERDDALVLGSAARASCRRADSRDFRRAYSLRTPRRREREPKRGSQGPAPLHAQSCAPRMRACAARDVAAELVGAELRESRSRSAGSGDRRLACSAMCSKSLGTPFERSISNCRPALIAQYLGFVNVTVRSPCL